MRDKNSNLVANRLVKAFLKNKIINPISSKYTKKLLNADKFRKLCESKIKKPIIGFMILFLRKAFTSLLATKFEFLSFIKYHLLYKFLTRELFRLKSLFFRHFYMF